MNAGVHAAAKAANRINSRWAHKMKDAIYLELLCFPLHFCACQRVCVSRALLKRGTGDSAQAAKPRRSAVTGDGNAERRGFLSLCKGLSGLICE